MSRLLGSHPTSQAATAQQMPASALGSLSPMSVDQLKAIAGLGTRRCLPPGLPAHHGSGSASATLSASGGPVSPSAAAHCPPAHELPGHDQRRETFPVDPNSGPPPPYHNASAGQHTTYGGGDGSFRILGVLRPADSAVLVGGPSGNVSAPGLGDLSNFQYHPIESFPDVITGQPQQHQVFSLGSRIGMSSMHLTAMPAIGHPVVSLVRSLRKASLHV